VILPDGTMSEGWIGGGCARAAVLKGRARSARRRQVATDLVQPPDVLQEQGIAPGDERAGVRFANNMCPSHGTMTSLSSRSAASADRDLRRKPGRSGDRRPRPSRRVRRDRVRAGGDQMAFSEADRRIEGYALPVAEA